MSQMIWEDDMGGLELHSTPPLTYHPPPRHANFNVSTLYFQIEERINIDTLEALKKAFHVADVDGTGGLELDEFKALLKNQLNISGNKVGVYIVVVQP